MTVTIDDVEGWMKVGTSFPANSRAQLQKALEAVKAYMLSHYDNLPAGGEANWTKDIDLAVILETARQYKRTGTPQGVDTFAEFGAIRVSRFLDPDAVRLLDPYLLPAIA